MALSRLYKLLYHLDWFIEIIMYNHVLVSFVTELHEFRTCRSDKTQPPNTYSIAIARRDCTLELLQGDIIYLIFLPGQKNNLVTFLS